MKDIATDQQAVATVSKPAREAGSWRRGYAMDPKEVFSRCQDHVIGSARAHVERLVLEAFVEKVRATPDGPNKSALYLLCDLYALSAIEADRGWWQEHGRLTSSRSKAISKEISELCRKLRPIAEELVDAFGVPAEMQAAEMLAPGSVEGDRR